MPHFQADRLARLLPCALLLGAAACGNAKLDKVNHVVVIYLENRSFDNLYGEFPGAEGLSTSSATATQVDANGAAYTTLPQPMNTSQRPAVADARFPANLPNAPFNIDQYVAANQATGDLVHRFYQEQLQIDGGKMDKFAQISDAKGLAMGFYHTAGLPLAAEASKYVLLDHFHHAAFGGSFLNHIWLVAAASPTFPSAPDALVAQLDSNGNLVKDGAVTPDGFAVNTIFTVNSPHPASIPTQNLLPNQTLPTIGDRLNDAKVSWAWYSGGWNDALANKAASSFQFHHQPLAYFANFADGTQARADHLKDEQDFLTAASAGNLPAVSFIKPLGAVNEHPGYSEVIQGEQHVVDLINVVRNGPQWKDTMIIITYDENGGFWDHVAPPAGDKWGPGTRVPSLVISPLAKQGAIDHTVYDTTSILATLEHRWGLKPLGDRDAKAKDLEATLK